MAPIVMVGGGIAALTTAMLLADDGHAVTVLERDPADPAAGGQPPPARLSSLLTGAGADP
jgi:uncharacterized protein with NAD-binding domain and iron-sulfur cluster